MKHPRHDFDVEKLVNQSTTENCFICEFLSGNPDFPHVEVFSTGEHTVFLDRYPTMFGKVFVAPTQHFEGVTADFSLKTYLDMQTLVYQTAEAVRRALNPERIYVLSLGSKAANSHVHWHIAPLPAGVPLEQQQYHALMHEHGTVHISPEERSRYAKQLREYLESVVA
jgi:histidine triad (HIT) family protein